MIDIIEVLQRLANLLELSNKTESLIYSTYKDAQEALAWFIKPNNRLAQFGDCNEQYIYLDDIEKIVGKDNIHPLLAWSLNQTNTERPDDNDFRIFHDAGYAIFKQEKGQDNKRSSAAYLALNAAFHSRVHKHNDDLSIEWSDATKDILFEPGSYGYEGRPARGSELDKLGFYYSQPARVYVESPHAHNTVEINGAPDNRNIAEYYGSGINHGGITEQGSVLY